MPPFVGPMGRSCSKLGVKLDPVLARCLVLGLILSGGAMAQAKEPPEPVQVLVLGSYHMGNPGEDLHNIRADPVTTDRRQAEIQAVVDALARFQPTAVAVERVAADPATLLDQKFPSFQQADLRTNPDERVQLGYRLAHQLKLTRVYAIDEQAGPGEADYFPFDKLDAWARAHGHAGEIEAMHARMKVEVARQEEEQGRWTVAQILSRDNRPDSDRGAVGHGPLYYGSFLTIGAGHEQPGADLNGRWYTRNAKIFAKLAQVTRPGDRVVVVYGSGHNYWLRHFAATIPGFASVDPLPYLRVASPGPATRHQP